MKKRSSAKATYAIGVVITEDRVSGQVNSLVAIVTSYQRTGKVFKKKLFPENNRPKKKQTSKLTTHTWTHWQLVKNIFKKKQKKKQKKKHEDK